MNDSKILIINERQILHAIIDDPEKLPTENYFISEPAKEYYDVFCMLRECNQSFIFEHIFKIPNLVYINEENYNIIISTNYDEESFTNYLNELRATGNVRDTISAFNDVMGKGLTYVEKENELIKYCEKFMQSRLTFNNDGLNFSQLLYNHSMLVEKRSHTQIVSTGCSTLDRLIPSVTAGIITVVGYSGSYKSTFIQYLVKQRIVKRLPTIFFNTELARDAVMDSLTASMVEKSYNDIQGKMNDDDHIDFLDIAESYRRLSTVYTDDKINFRMYDGQTVSLNTLEDFCLKSQKEFNINKELPTFVFVDLLSMVTDFCDSNGNLTTAITTSLNRLNTFATENNFVIIGTVQLKRFPTHINITTFEDLDRFKPTLEMIKDSGTWEERSRVVLAIHNPKHIAEKQHASESVIESLGKDIIVEIMALKSSYDFSVGKSVYYKIDQCYKSFVPHAEEEEEKNE